MVRVNTAKTTSKRRKKYLKLAKGYVGLNSRSLIMASEQIKQSLNFAYIGRRLKKRDFRKLWILRINGALHTLNYNYSKFIGNLKKSNIFLDRKSLAFIALNDSIAFERILSFIQN